MAGRPALTQPLFAVTEGTSSSGDSGLGLPELFSEEGPRRGAQVPTLSQHTTMVSPHS